MLNLRHSLVAASLLILSSCSFFEDVPGEKEILPSIAAVVPGILSVDKVELKAQQNVGSDTRPEYESRFIASASLGEDLFVRVGSIDTRDVVAKSHSKGEVINIYGFSKSVKAQEQWKTTVELESITMSPNDRPLGTYRLPIIQGSPEEAEAQENFLKKQEAEKLAQQQRLEAERADQIKKQEAELERQRIQNEEAARAAERERVAKEAERKNIIDQLAGKWTGTYVCGQGQTGLKVTIKDWVSEKEMSGEFHFYPLDATNKRAAEGKFEIFVSYNPSSKNIVARPGPWIEKPSGFFTVGFRGNVKGGDIVGVIDSSGCGSMKVTRS